MEAVAEAAEVSDAESSDWEIDQPEKPKPRQPVRVVEKDAEEAELERLVLGDKAGFRAQLFQPGTVDDAETYMKELSLAVVPDDDDEDTGLAELDDSNMFFTDDAPLPGAAPEAAAGAAPAGAKDTADKEDAPAWEDSDDERLRVSLTKHSQLHRLRRFVGEDIVSGADYCERLREQYLRLNPQPDWATDARKAQKRREATALARRRRRSGSGSGSDDSSSESEEDGAVDADVLPLDKFFRSAGALAAAGNQQQTKASSRKRRKLKPEVLNIMKTRDIPTRHAGPVMSLAFHPQYAVLLSCSVSSTLHIHQVAPGALPTPNPLLTAVRVTGMPVHRAVFVDPAGTQVAFAGPRRFMHTWDLNSGQVQRISRMQGRRLEQRTMDRFRVSPDGLHLAMIESEQKSGGSINVMSVRTMQWVAHARLDSPGGLIDFQWWRNSAGLTLLGRDGSVGEWRLEARRFVGIWRDEGAVGGKAIALGGRGGPDSIGGDRWVAVGSGSGIVNIYERQELVEATDTAGGEEDSPARLVTIKARPKPRRCFEQLTTPATHLVFSPDGQLLAFASQYKGDALRLAHLPSCTVYRNWPTQQTGLGQVTAVAFSAESDMLAVANVRGQTRLWEIRG